MGRSEAREGDDEEHGVHGVTRDEGVREPATAFGRQSKLKLELKHNKFEFKLYLAADARGNGRRRNMSALTARGILFSPPESDLA